MDYMQYKQQMQKTAADDDGYDYGDLAATGLAGLGVGAAAAPAYRALRHKTGLDPVGDLASGAGRLYGKAKARVANTGAGRFYGLLSEILARRGLAARGDALNDAYVERANMIMNSGTDPSIPDALVQDAMSQNESLLDAMDRNDLAYNRAGRNIKALKLKLQRNNPWLYRLGQFGMKMKRRFSRGK